MKPEELDAKLTPNTPDIKQEGDADYPCGNADGVIFFGRKVDAVSERHGVKVTMPDKQAFYHAAMTYVRRPDKKARTRADGHVNEFGVCCPSGLLDILLRHYPNIVKAADKENRTLELLLADDPKWRFDATTDKRLPYWHIYPVATGIWAILYDEDIEETEKSTKSLVAKQREGKTIAEKRSKEIKMENEVSP